MSRTDKTPNAVSGGVPDMATELNGDRRAFIKKVLKGAIGGSLLLVIPLEAGVGEKQENDFDKIPEQIPGIRGQEYDMSSRQFAFVVDITRCIGCGSCCVADKREYNVPDGNYRTWVERYVKDFDDNVYVDSPKGGVEGYQEPRPELKGKIRDTFFVPKLCNMCKKPSCVQVCPVGATFKSPDGFILVDSKRCVGCGYCIQACPYSARFLHPVTRTAEKCTWCYHRVRKGLLPVCVHVCPTKARKFGDMNDKKSEVYKILRSHDVITVLKKDMGNAPSLYYKGVRREVV
ncbi:4Fe-4S dicluster domain-containing protein [Desulfobacterales bacterium HSG16]|nr:4Fe-4S dicluster domain-containing protein [Desulfobacterales bacterium HSG16]